MAQRNTYREDEELEEQINFRDILRVGKYLKPYMAQVARILVVVISMSCIVVAVPYLTKIMIDEAIPNKDLGKLGILAVNPRRADRAVRVRAALPHGGDHARRPAHAQGHAPRYLHAYPDAALQLLRFAPARQDPDPRGQLCEHAFGHAELRSDQRDPPTCSPS